MQYRLSTLFLLFVVLWSSLAVFGVGGIAVFVVTVGIAVYIHRAKSVESAVMNLVLIAIGVLVLFALLLPAVQSARSASARQTQCRNNMKRIALALLNYDQVYKCFPPAYVADKNGKPMHSWRVLILPYMEEGSLYKQYNFNEPWDGPNNKKLLAARPAVFRCPGGDDVNPQGATETSYVAVVGAHAAWQGERPRTSGDFGGALSDTIMLVEAADAGIQWTEPTDLSLEALEAAGAKPPAVTASSRHGNRKDFFYTYRYPGGVGGTVAMADGRVQFLPPGAVPPEILPKLLRIGGCKDADLAYLPLNRNEQRQLNWDNLVALAIWIMSVVWLFYRAVRSRKGAGELAVATAGGMGPPMNTDKNGSDQ